MRPTVSIGMPVFNDRPFLAAALDALLAQSYEHFELIISDDGSSDGSEAICRAYAARDSRIRYVRQAENIGISRNMMYLLAQARGEYFMWAANDDLWHRDFVATLLGALEANPGSISAFTPMHFINEQDQELAEPPPRATDYSGSTAHERLRKLVRVFDDSFGYGLFRRDAISGVRFPVWWWINKKRAYNNIYPTLCYYLAKGDFVLAGAAPMWLNRLKSNEKVNHRVPYSGSFLRGLLAFVLWKFNLVAVSLNQIVRAGEGLIAIRVAPAMVASWLVLPAVNECVVRASQLRRRRISFL